MLTPVGHHDRRDDEDPRTRSPRRVSRRHEEAVDEVADLKRDLSESPPKRPVRARIGEPNADEVPPPPRPVAPRPAPSKRERNTPDEDSRKAHMPSTPAGRATSHQKKGQREGTATRSTTTGAVPEPKPVCSFYTIDQRKCASS